MPSELVKTSASFRKGRWFGIPHLRGGLKFVLRTAFPERAENPSDRATALLGLREQRSSHSEVRIGSSDKFRLYLILGMRGCSGPVPIGPRSQVPDNQGGRAERVRSSRSQRPDRISFSHVSKRGGPRFDTATVSCNMTSMLNVVLDKLYGTLDGSVEWQTALQSAIEAAGAERLSIHSLAQDGVFRQETEPFDPEGVLRYSRDFADKDLRVERILGGRRGVLATETLMTHEEIARCPVHNEFYRIYPECWNGVITALDGDKALWAPSFYRSARHGRFSEEEKRRMAVLAHHISRVAEARLKLPSPDSILSSDGIIAAYDALDDGIVIFDQFGFILHMNLAARNLAGASDGIAVRGGILVASHRECAEPLAAMMAATIRVAAGEAYDIPRPIGLRRTTTPHPLLVRAYVSPSGVDANRIGVLKLQDHSDWALPSPEMVQMATGLSPAEIAACDRPARGPRRIGLCGAGRCFRAHGPHPAEDDPREAPCLSSGGYRRCHRQVVPRMSKLLNERNLFFVAQDYPSPGSASNKTNVSVAELCLSSSSG